MNGSNGVRTLMMLMARWGGYASALFLAAMMLITVADVGSRALFNLPITGAYDLVQLFLVGTIFLSIPDVFLRDENIVIDFVDHLLVRFPLEVGLGAVKISRDRIHLLQDRIQGRRIRRFWFRGRIKAENSACEQNRDQARERFHSEFLFHFLIEPHYSRFARTL